MNLRRYNLLLLGLVLVLGVTLALLRTQGSETSPAQSEAEQQAQQQLDVTRAASSEVLAFLSIGNDNFDTTAQVVLDGATGTFKQQYSTELKSLKKSARDQKSTAQASVLEVGISDIEAGRATVLVAANTDVTSQATEGQSRTVPWRIQLDMVKEGGRWLTSGLRFVG